MYPQCWKYDNEFSGEIIAIAEVHAENRMTGPEYFPVDDQGMRDRDGEAKERGKLYADRKCGAW